jgi:hypothetical protein
MFSPPLSVENQSMELSLSIMFSEMEKTLLELSPRLFLEEVKTLKKA